MITEKESNARHEAAHVAMYCLLGYRVERVTIKSFADEFGHQYGGMVMPGEDLNDWRDEILICRSGLHIDKNSPYIGLRYVIVVNGEDILPNGDEERIEYLLNQNFSGNEFEKRSLRDELFSEVERRLDQPEVLAGIDALAKELLIRETLSGDAAQNIFNSAKSASAHQIRKQR